MYAFIVLVVRMMVALVGAVRTRTVCVRVLLERCHLLLEVSSKCLSQLERAQSQHLHNEKMSKRKANGS